MFQKQFKVCHKSFPFWNSVTRQEEEEQGPSCGRPQQQQQQCHYSPGASTIHKNNGETRVAFVSPHSPILCHLPPCKIQYKFSLSWLSWGRNMKMLPDFYRFRFQGQHQHCGKRNPHTLPRNWNIWKVIWLCFMMIFRFSWVQHILLGRACFGAENIGGPKIDRRELQDGLSSIKGSIANFKVSLSDNAI